MPETGLRRAGPVHTAPPGSALGYLANLSRYPSAVCGSRAANDPVAGWQYRATTDPTGAATTNASAQAGGTVQAMIAEGRKRATSPCILPRTPAHARVPVQWSKQEAPCRGGRTWLHPGGSRSAVTGPCRLGLQARSRSSSRACARSPEPRRWRPVQMPRHRRSRPLRQRSFCLLRPALPDHRRSRIPSAIHS